MGWAGEVWGGGGGGGGGGRCCAGEETHTSLHASAFYIVLEYGRTAHRAHPVCRMHVLLCVLWVISRSFLLLLIAFVRVFCVCLYTAQFEFGL